ncbi:DinB family protein [Edaphobacter sp.]|uniref:DinB family protein n=1 Tax=Edaphobacter sp. TaxID=1934404 RepID=UPI002DC05B83|nr:DinB family protein [Edaphobacter sp.]HEU5339790.1 DinB family protein [Edaphobacter sp.]
MSGAYIEPWLRGTLTEVDAVRRQVLHALELAVEDVEKWCAGLTDAEMNARPFEIAPVAFHLRHMVRSLDRLLAYAEGAQLSEAQMVGLRSELDGGASAVAVLAEFRAGMADAARRVKAISPDSYEAPRGVGRKMLPTTVGGLMVHCAEHTQRHVGQAVTTVKVVKGIEV